LKEQGLVALLRLLSKTTSPFLLKIGCWAVSNLCRSYPYPPYELVKPALPFFCKILVNEEVSDKETMADILWAMSSLTEGGKSKLKFIIESGVIGKLFTYCSEPFDKISIPALRILGNFSLGNSVISNFLLTNNIL
jgi:importin subunit alpha-1